MPSRVSNTDNEIYKHIGHRIQQIRQQRGITQESVAETTGLAAKYIGFIEQGRKRPRVHILMNIAKALGTDIKDFF